MVIQPPLPRRLEVRELLSRHGFPGSATPVVKGSALKAPANDADELGVPAIIKLVAEWRWRRELKQPHTRRAAPLP